MSIDLNTNLNVANNVSSDSTNGIQKKTALPINLTSGSITLDDNPETVNFILNSANDLFKNNKLTNPTYKLADLGNINIPIDKEAAKCLGIGKGKLSLPQFIDACINKLVGSGVIQGKTGTKKTESITSIVTSNNKIDLSKLSAESLALLCLLTTQNSKSKLIETLKNALQSKINERQNTNNELIAAKNKSAAEITESIKAQKKSKIRGIFKAIFSAITAVIGTIVSAVITVATAGGATPLVVAAYAGLGLAIAGAICSCVGSGLTIASLCTDDSKLQERLGKANLAFGISSAILGLGSALCSGVSTIGSFFTKAPAIAKNISQSVIKAVRTGGELIKATTTAAEGSLQIADGVENTKLAKNLIKIAETKIKIEELDAEIKVLANSIKSIQNFLEMFIKNMLEAEEKSASTINDASNTMLTIANKIA